MEEIDRLLEEEIDRLLDRYEDAAKQEKHFLLLSRFKLFNTDYEVQCGISPARTFSPVVIIKHQLTEIVCSTYEWYELITTLQYAQTSFFPVPGFQVAIDSAPLYCGNGDYMKVEKILYEGVKQLRLTKHLFVLYLLESDVEELLTINTALISNHINMLDELNFCMYYYNILDTVREWLANHKTILTVPEILKVICKASADCMLSRALSEYMFYYKDKLIL